MNTSNKKNLETALYSTAGLAAVLGLLIAVNLIGSVLKARVDLTADKLYTLSQGSRAILSKLNADTPVTIRFYSTESSTSMPVELKNYALSVRDILNEYKQAAHGGLRIETYDPQPDSDAEDSARLDGVQPQMLDANTGLYNGLTVSYLDKKVSIPFLAPARSTLLEYDISRAIAEAIQDKKPVIGVMSSLPVMGSKPSPSPYMQQQAKEPWVGIAELKNTFDVREVSMEDTTSIPPEITVLIVIHPEKINEKALFAIDQFVLRGGKLAAFLDPFNIISMQANPPQFGKSSLSNLEPLLKSWNITFDSKIVSDAKYRTQISQGNGMSSENPCVLSLDRDALNKDDVLTSSIDNLVLGMSGSFSGEPAAGLTETVLAHTSKQTEKVDSMRAQSPGDQLMQQLKPGGNELPLAIRLTGKFKSAYPNSPEPGALKESAQENTVILVADADMIADMFSVQKQSFFGRSIVTPLNANLSFFQSIVEQLGGDENLISVRSKGMLNRPFTRVREMQADAELKFRSRLTTLQQKQQEAQSRLNQLQAQKSADQKTVLSPEQQAEIVKFQKESANVNKELKKVRRDLRSEIDSLENNLKWLNIAGMPLIVIGVGLGMAATRRKRR